MTAETCNLNAPPAENCWKRIGVWGRETPPCPELKKVIHCRNCCVFTQAGRDFLERDLPEDYIREWTRIMATEKEDAMPGAVSVVIFSIETELIALRTLVSAEILIAGGLKRHKLPHRKNPVLLGLINVRGEIQLCVSLKRLLEIDNGGGKERKGRERYMIVARKDAEKWVFPADDVLGVFRIHPNQFENVPATVAKAQSTYTQSIFKWEDRHVAFLDDELVFFSLKRSVE